MGALARLAGPVTEQVVQVAALIELLQRRLIAFDQPLVARPASAPGTRRDNSFVDALRQAEAALRITERQTDLDADHPTVTQLARLQAELISASLAPLVQALIVLLGDAASLETALADASANGRR